MKNYNYSNKAEFIRLKSLDSKSTSVKRRNISTTGNSFLKKVSHGRREQPDGSLTGTYFDENQDQYQTADNQDLVSDNLFNIDAFSVSFPKETTAAKFSKELVNKKSQLPDPSK